MSKYSALRDYLSTRDEDRWVASFNEIETVLGFRLPNSARTYPAWWANQSTPGHSQCSGWLGAGWLTGELNLNGQHVTFTRFQTQRDIAQLHKPPKSSLGWSDVLEDPSESFNFELNLCWSRLGAIALDTKDMLAFPRTPICPAVYRFRVKSNKSQSTYFGEADEISRRFQHYRTPGPTQRTNQRLNSFIAECLRKGGTAEVDILCDANFCLETADSAVDMKDKFTRRLLENAAIVSAKTSGGLVINR